jgi:hypothetical protein
MIPHPAETGKVPLEDELRHFGSLQEIRTRADGRLVVHQLLRPPVDDGQMGELIVAFSAPEAKPFEFLVAREDANSAFEEPWYYAPPAGRVVLEALLRKSESTDLK